MDFGRWSTLENVETIKIKKNNKIKKPFIDIFCAGLKIKEISFFFVNF
jgi:hypothetical protein